MRQACELVRATKEFAQEQRWRSWWHLWSTLAVLIGLLGTTCLDLHWLVRLPLSILAGLVLVRMFVIYHDYQHGTILKGSWLADVLMLGFGLLTLNPPSVWNRSHNHHHKNNVKVPGDGIGSYPIMTTDSYARASWQARFQYAVVRHPVTILLGYLTMFLYDMCLRPLLLNPRQRFDAGICLAVHLAIVSVLAILAPDLLLLTVILPLAVAGAMGAYLFYAQHNFPDTKIRFDRDWNHVFAALHSSSYLTMNPVMHWFTGNIGYHHVHHLNAHIPFYRLPEAMAAMEELQSPSTTSLNPLSMYRCLRLKLWDPRKNRMVSFKGS